MAQEIIATEIKDQILEITFQMNEKNVVTAEFGITFNKILANATDNKEIRGILMKGSNGFLSNGFDPTSFVGANKAGIDAVIRPAFESCSKLLFNPLPSAIVINGHCMGFGAIMSLFTDYRYMQSKQARFGFPEIQIGLPIPLAPAILLQDLTGRLHVRDMVLGAKALKADQALEWGIVDAVMETEDEMVTQARKDLKKIFKYPRSVIALNRQTMYFRYKDIVTQAIKDDITLAVDAILAPAGQEGLGALMEGRRTNYQGIE